MERSARHHLLIEIDQFITKYRDVSWGLDSDTNFAGSDFDDNDFDIIANNNSFLEFSGQDQHNSILSSGFDGHGGIADTQCERYAKKLHTKDFL